MKYALSILILNNGNVWEKRYPTEQAYEKELKVYTHKLNDRGLSYIAEFQKL